MLVAILIHVRPISHFQTSENQRLSEVCRGAEMKSWLGLVTSSVLSSIYNIDCRGSLWNCGFRNLKKAIIVNLNVNAIGNTSECLLIVIA